MALQAVRAESAEAQIEVVGIMSLQQAQGEWGMSRSV